MGVPTPVIDCEVIHKQLLDVLEHRATSTDDTAESSPTSTYGTAHSELDDEPKAQVRPSKGPKDGTFILSHAVLKNIPEAHNNPSKTQKGRSVVPAYPMTKKNIKPARIYADTSKIPADCLSFAFLTKDEKDYITALQKNWDNPSVPPIRPEAPEGSTLNTSLNYHSLQTMQRLPPRQVFASSNARCINMLSDWEVELTKEDHESEREISKNTNIHRCRELREELLAQRSSFEEGVSTKIVLGRAVWQHEAFKQVKKERDRVKELEAELARERKDKVGIEAALSRILEEQRANPHVEHLEAFSQHMQKEIEENNNLLADFEAYQHIYDNDGRERPGTLEVGVTLAERMMDYIRHRKTALQEEKQLLGKFVDIRIFKHDKGNMIMLTLQEIVESFQKKKQELHNQLDEARELLVCGSTLTSPGLPGLPSPPPGAALYDSVEGLEKRIKDLEKKDVQMAYSCRVASSFTKFWMLYRECKFQRGEQHELGESEYNGDDDDDYEEDPCPEPAANEERVPVLPEDQKVQWLTDLITKAVEAWTEEVYRPTATIASHGEKICTLAKGIDLVTTRLKKMEYQKSLVGSENSRLREKVKNLEFRLAEYIDFMQKIGIETDKEFIGTEECLYTSIQSLGSLKDENLRLKLLIDGLNGKIEELNSALDLCEEALVPWPSANRLEESLAEGLQVYADMFGEHKAWLRGFGKVNEDSRVEDEGVGEKKVDVVAEMQEGIDAGMTLGEGVAGGLDVLAAVTEGIETGWTFREAMGLEQFPRRKPPVVGDEQSVLDVEAMNEAMTRRRVVGDEQSVAEVEAMMGLTQLRQSKFVESFDDDGEYGRLRVD